MADGPPLIFDRAAYRNHRVRAAAIPSDLFLADEAAQALALRVAAVNRKFQFGLDLGSRDTCFPTVRPLATEWVRAGLDAAGRSNVPEVVATEEAQPFGEEVFDLVVSVLSLHAVNDLPGALLQIRRSLKPDGLFVGALFGEETLSELRRSLGESEAELRGGVSPRVFPFSDVRSLGGLLQRAGFALPVTDIERTTVRYSDPLKLFHDLRAMGETNALRERAQTLMGKTLLGTALENYCARNGGDDGRVTATFDIVYLTGWAPHESQQKPLRPGTAIRSLADELGSRDIR
jgi:SAM-dependent methyltransferase